MNVISVSQLNSYIKAVIEETPNLNRIYVKGEISNFTNHYQSGHLYFSLKDKKSIVKCVMFASSAKRVKFAPENGMEVLLRARVSVYEASGQYQLYVEDMQPDGVGALNLAFEQLKQKLGKEGLFSEIRKKQLPIYPQKIGIITSPTGAAVQDMFRILSRRWSMAELVFCPCTVQGEYAESELVAAMDLMEKQENIDVIIIGRGGGSTEDLWAFNSEKLARKIFSCKTPVVSAVGHETDFTICDFVADVRASTPSAAAELVVPEKEEELEKVFAMHSRLKYIEKRKIEDLQIAIDGLSNFEQIFRKYIIAKEDKLKILSKEMCFFAEKNIQKTAIKYSGLSEKLDALSPLKVMARGFSVLEKENNIVKSVQSLKVGEKITAKFTDGTAKLEVIELEKI